jgi:hypothetical protein
MQQKARVFQQEEALHYLQSAEEQRLEATWHATQAINIWKLFDWLSKLKALY